ncbi:hypothetical protein PR001_g2912 [Phytophthora rubi]|uniref:Uncharacterized protein n=1 Tax=Phytophthora rubi TaxID=129364 RepID=A0A6A3P7C5_9STRA|nr:hypothetical protein PR001_g2912 [Phytophthora rubi]
MTREVWFELVDIEGNALTDRVKELADTANVADLRDAVFARMSPALPEKFVAAYLTVFKNRAATKALGEDELIGSSGGSKQDALIVVVPAQRRVVMDEQPPHKKARLSTVINDEDIESIGHNLDIDEWHVGGIALNICHVESDFPRVVLRSKGITGNLQGIQGPDGSKT